MNRDIEKKICQILSFFDKYISIDKIYEYLTNNFKTKISIKELKSGIKKIDFLEVNKFGKYFFKDIELSEKYFLTISKQQALKIYKYFEKIRSSFYWNYKTENDKNIFLRINLFIENDFNIYPIDDYKSLKTKVDLFLDKKLDYKLNYNYVVNLFGNYIYKKMLKWEKIDTDIKKIKKIPDLYEKFINSSAKFVIIYYHILKGELKEVQEIVLTFKGLENDYKPLIEGVIKALTQNDQIAMKYFKKSFDILKKYKEHSSDYHFLTEIFIMFEYFVIFFSLCKFPTFYTQLHTTWFRRETTSYNTPAILNLYKMIIKKSDNDYNYEDQSIGEFIVKDFFGIDTLFDIFSYCLTFQIEDWDFDFFLTLLSKSIKKGYYWIAIELVEILKHVDKFEDSYKTYKKLLKDRGVGITPIASNLKFKSKKSFFLELLENDLPSDNEVIKNERIVWILEKNSFSYYSDKIYRLTPYYQKRLKSGAWNSGKEARIDQLKTIYFELLSKKEIEIVQNFSIVDGIPFFEYINNFVGLGNIYHQYQQTIPIKVETCKPTVGIFDNKGYFYIAFDSRGAVWTNEKGSIWIFQKGEFNYKVVNIKDSTFKILNYLQNNVVRFSKSEEDKKKLVDWIEKNKTLNIEAPFYIADKEDSIEVKTEPKGIVEIKHQNFENMTGFALDIFIEPAKNWDIYKIDEMGEIIAKKGVNGEDYFIKRDIDRELKIYKSIYKIFSIDLDKGGKNNKIFIGNSEIFYFIDKIINLKNIEIRLIENGKKSKIKYLKSGQVKWNISKSKNWFEIEGSIELDKDQQIQIAKYLGDIGKEKFITLEDGEVAVFESKLREQIKNIDKLTVNEGDKLVFPTPIVEHIDKLLPNIENNYLDNWRDSVKKLKDIEKMDVKIPKNVETILRNYQKIGVKWILSMVSKNFGVCLADDMGLGKTVQTIFSIYLYPGETLIITPASVLYNWKAEFEKFMPTFNTFIYEGDGREDILKQMDKNSIILVSYDTFQRDKDHFYEKNWDWIVLDEAQMIKNYQTKRAKSVFKLKGDKRVALSGTPIENHLGELWSLFHFLNPELLGSNRFFLNNFVKPILDGDKNRKELLKKTLSPFLLRRLKKEVLKELPDKIESVVWVDLIGSERTYYESLRLQGLKDLSEEGENSKKGEKRIKVLSHLMKLRRATCDISLVGKSIKNSSKTGAMEIIVPPELGYGNQSYKGLKPNSTLKYEMALVQIDAEDPIQPFNIEGIKRCKTKDKLQYYVVQEGEGDKAKKGDNAYVHYTGFLSDGSIFDSSHKRGKPVRITVGGGHVFKGWDLAIQTMNKGTKARFIIPAHLAFGKDGYKQIVPPNEILTMDMELVNLTPEITVKLWDASHKDTLETESGLRYIIFENGEGELVGADNAVEVHYSGYFTDGRLFDSSVKREEPIKFPIGVGVVIDGWDEGIQLMRKGAKYQFLIPAKLAYGEAGAPPQIPANADLIFDIEVLDVIR